MVFFKGFSVLVKYKKEAFKPNPDDRYGTDTAQINKTCHRIARYPLIAGNSSAI
jgi:hypothetical protein